MSGLLLKGLFILLALAATAGAKYYLHLKDDNPVEEMSEEVIKYETGIDIDLTPETPEKN